MKKKEKKKKGKRREKKRKKRERKKREKEKKIKERKRRKKEGGNRLERLESYNIHDSEDLSYWFPSYKWTWSMDTPSIILTKRRINI